MCAYVIVAVGQLWWLLVAGCPGLWTEQRSDKGELVSDRQLEGYVGSAAEAIE